MTSVHDRLGAIRELAALERAITAAPDSRTIRDALDTAWSHAYEASSDDEYRTLLVDVDAAAKRLACTTCGGVGLVADWQQHAGAYEREPITQPCPDCCVRCDGTGLAERKDVMKYPIIDEHGTQIDAIDVGVQTVATYCYCRFGAARREDDERRSL